MSACGPRASPNARASRSDPDRAAARRGERHGRARDRLEPCRGDGPRRRRESRRRCSPNEPPAPVAVMSESDVQRLFGDALAALPPAPQHFTLYFRFESDELTEESRALVPEILQASRTRPVPDRRRRRAHGHDGHARSELRARAASAPDGSQPPRRSRRRRGRHRGRPRTASRTCWFQRRTRSLEPRNRRVEISVR